MDKEHAARIKRELRAVGVTSYGLLKYEARHLPNHIHPEEHIGGTVYGRIATGDSAFLVATDRRVLYYDRKPLYSTFDELTYDVVSGVRINHAAGFATVILHTRITDYSIRFVNLKCAKIFAAYIEKRRLESERGYSVNTQYTPEPLPPLAPDFDKQAMAFLKEHDLGVLSTIDRTGNVHGAIIYYIVGSNDHVYLLTKTTTAKGRNVYAHNQVALTVHEPGTQQTLQMEGTAEVETDQITKENVFAQMTQARPYRKGMQLPPITKLHEGDFMVINITPQVLSYHDYSQMS